MFWNKKSKGKQKIKPTVLAQILYDEFVCDSSISRNTKLRISQGAASSFQNKAKLYQFSCVLIALLQAEQENQKFRQVRAHLEAIYHLSSTIEPSTTTQSLPDVQSAMSEIVGLNRPVEESKYFTWARGWLEAVDVEEYNPVELHLFAMRWINFLIMAIDALAKFDLVA